MLREIGLYKKIVVVLLVVGFLWLYKYNQLKENNSSLQNQLWSYQEALEEANDNIDEANSIIEDAQNYSWSSYDDMGYALDNLYTVSTVQEP